MDKEKFINEGDALFNYAMLDDADVLSAIKVWSGHPDKVLSLLSDSLINRRLFKTDIRETPFSEADCDGKISEYSRKLELTQHEASFLFSQNVVSASTYVPCDEDSNINVLYSDGSLKDISEASDILNISSISKQVSKYFFCYYKG